MESVDEPDELAMHRRTPKLLEHIRNAAASIGEATRGLRLEDYKSDRLLRQGVERNFEVIGETIERLAGVDSSTAERIGDCRQIVAFRDTLIHGNDLGDSELVWQTIRTQLIALHRNTVALLTCFARLPRGLYVLTPETPDDEWLVKATAAAIRGGASTVQYRSKRLGAAERLRQGRRLRETCRALGATFLVNDSPELARELDADGVHLGRDDAELAQARAVLGPGAIIGVSCYDSFERAMETRALADYCAFGSVFSSRVKPAAVRASLSLFAQARKAALHAVAIGGIDEGNAGRVAAAGAAAVAVITAVFGESDEMRRGEEQIENVARRLSRAFEDGRTA